MLFIVHMFTTVMVVRAESSNEIMLREHCHRQKLSILCRVCECDSGLHRVATVKCRDTNKFMRIDADLLKNAAACYLKQKKQVTVEFADSFNPLVLSWKKIAVKPLVLENLNLSSSLLSCDCGNAWIHWYEKLGRNVLIQDPYWRDHFQCKECDNVTPRLILHFPHNIQIPQSLYCQAAGRRFTFASYIDENCGYPNLKIRFSDDSQDRISCFSDERSLNHSDACVTGQIASFFRNFPITSNLKTVEDSRKDSACSSSFSYNLEELNVEDSGWLLCILNSSILPSALMTRLTVQGPPVFLKFLPLKISKDFQVNITLASSTPVSFSWFYIAGRIENSQEIWEILPNKTDRFVLDVYSGSFLNGWMTTALVARFPNPDIKCNGGWFYFDVCNQFNCTRKFFMVNSTRPVSCASPNDTFFVTGIFHYPPLNQTKESTVDTIDPVEPSPSNPSHLLIVLLSLVLVTVITGGLAVIICLKRKRVARKSWIFRQSRVTGNGSVEMDEWRSKSQVQMKENTVYVDWLQGLLTNEKELQIQRQLGEGAFGCVFLVKRIKQFPATDIRITKPVSSSLLTVQDACSRSRYANSELNLARQNRADSSTALLLRSKSSSVSSRAEALRGSRQADLMAMKLLKHITEEKLKDLEREASVLTQLDHPNIVQFYGITVQGDQEFALLFEYMNNGDLVHYLREHNPDLIEDESRVGPLQYADLLRISLQVASGLEYLVMNHLVHRDLAARNCLVGEDRNVKLSDFGMTRDLYVTDYYKMGAHTLVPLRWLPPESVLYRKFTKESDIWSFGVLLWEVFSYGQVPWCGYSNSEVMDIVKAGRILEKPGLCPGEVYENLILRCCRVKASDRISASRAKDIIGGMLENLCGYCAIQRGESIDSSNARKASRESETCDPQNTDESLEPSFPGIPGNLTELETFL